MADPVDKKPFQRANAILGLGRNTLLSSSLTSFAIDQFASGGMGDPRNVPFYALECMSTHPTIYLAERTIASIILRPNLYSVVHSDPKVVKEVEAWLWPLFPVLLKAYVRAFAYGAAPVVLNWGNETLRTEVNGRKKTLKNHTHFVSAHVIRPSEVDIEHDNDVLETVIFEGERYDAERARVIVWDGEFGSFRGQGARRRCWRDYCSSLAIEGLEAAYLERSVDNPRIGYAPSGTESFEGTEQDSIAFMVQQLMSLRGTGAAVFPSNVDADGNKEYSLETLDIPDRESIWERALDRRDKRMLDSYLAVGGGDSAAQARTVEGLLKEMIQSIAEWVAQDLTQIVEIVHGKNHPESKLSPEVEATDVGKAQAMKLLAEITKLSSGQVARWLDVPAALDKLGVPVLDEELEPEVPVMAPEAAPGEKPTDVSSEREERREDARTEPGASDTGQKDREDMSALPTRRDAQFEMPTIILNMPDVSVTPPNVEIVVEPAEIVVNLSAPEAPAITVQAPEVNLEAPVIHVSPPEVVVNVPAAVVNVEAPVVNVPAPVVNVSIPSFEKKKLKIRRGPNGEILGADEV